MGDGAKVRNLFLVSACGALRAMSGEKDLCRAAARLIRTLLGQHSLRSLYPFLSISTSICI